MRIIVRGQAIDLLRLLLPAFGLLAVGAGIYIYRANAMSYLGFNLLLT